MQIMKVLNYLKSISLVCGGSLLMFGCIDRNPEIEYSDQTYTFEITYGKNKVDTVTATGAIFDDKTKCVWLRNGGKIMSVYYDVERVKEIDN